MGKFDDPDMPPSEFPPEALAERPKVIPLKPKTPEPLFPVTWVSEAILKLDTKPLIKGLLDPGAFGLIYGPSGSGKSFFTADMAQHIAQGAMWRGRKVTQGLVVYVASEAGSSILKRFVGWRDHGLGEAAGKIPLAVMTRGPVLLNLVDFSKFEEQLQALVTESGLPLLLVIFDTLSRSIPGGDENNAKDMTMAIQSADMLRAKFNCATIFVHHTGKNKDQGARGHSSLFAAADLVLLVADKSALVEKVRDGVAGEKFEFELKPIEIGTDVDGDAVFTCLLELASETRQVRRSDPTGKNQRVVYREVKELAKAAEISAGTSVIPKGVRIIKFNDLVDRAAPRFAGVEAFRARARIGEAITSLQSSGYVGVHGDFLWPL